MAIIKVNNKTRIVVSFQQQELRRYTGLEANIVTAHKKVLVNIGLSFITWQGHDRRVAEDLIGALKLIGNAAAKAKSARIGWTGHAHPATILRDDKVRIPVYANHSEPYVQIERVDAFVKWSIQGHYFNDDLPSISAYVAAITQLINYAYEMR